MSAQEALHDERSPDGGAMSGSEALMHVHPNQRFTS